MNDFASTDRVSFFPSMPKKGEGLERALAKTDEELAGELMLAITDMRIRRDEGGTAEQVEARTNQLAAAERALARIRKRLAKK